MAADSAVLDACVLIPAALCDTLLRTARRGLYRPLWTEQILAEVQRNLVRSGLVTDEAKAQRRVEAMRNAFRADRALVSGYEALIEQMPNQSKDRHVLAAAVAADATTIVTFNLRDFQTRGTPQEAIRPRHPDTFLLDLFSLYPAEIVDVLQIQAAALRKGGQVWSPERILDNLARQSIPTFANAVREHLSRQQ